MRRIRLQLTGAPGSGLSDQLTRATPALWDGDGLKVQVFLCDPEDRSAAFDISTIASLSLEIRLTETTAAALVGPVDDDDLELSECTLCEWERGDSQHAEFTIPGDLLDFAVGTRRVWMSIRAEITDGEPVTFGAGYVTVAHSGPTDATSAPVLMLISATPDDTSGELTFSASGYTFTVPVHNFASTGDRVGVVRLTSTAPDGTYGEHSFSAGDCTWTMALNNFTAS